jgi:hypothetical protein
MAQSFASSVLSIKQRFGQLLPAAVILQATTAAGHAWRRRKFDPVLTIHLFLLQVLHGNTAILHLRHLVGEAVNAAAYCRARMRLPLVVYESLLDYSASLHQGQGRSVLGGIARVLLVDGCCSLLPDTRSIRRLFKQPANIKPGCGYPLAKLLAVFDAASGCVLRPFICSMFVHEGSSAWKLHPLLNEGDLLVGDRAFCSYVHLAMLTMRGIHGCFRMQQRQIVDFRVGRRHGGTGRPGSRFVRKLGPLDQLVEWFKPKLKPKWMSKRQYQALPDSLILRELRYHLVARGQRTRVVTLVTTLSDVQLHPAQQIVHLYGLRWQVETHFRQLKCTMRMKQIKCRTAAGAKKELLMHLIVYNLIRRVMLDAATSQGVDVHRISFIDAQRWLASNAAGLTVLVVIPLRPNRHEPRVKKYLNYRYTPMTTPRHIMLKRPYLYADKVK